MFQIPTPINTTTPDISPTPENSKTFCSIDDATVAYYSFNEDGERLVDLSQNALHGFTKGAEWVQGGVSGKAFRFNGLSSFLQIPYSDSFNIQKGLTLEAWIKREKRTNDWEAVISRYSWGHTKGFRSYELMISSWDTASFHISANGLENTEVVVESKKLVLFNEWTHIAGSWDGTTMRLFVNGEEQGSKPFVGPIFPVDREITIGASNLGEGQFFSGMIDEVRISNKARTDLCSKIPKQTQESK